MARYTSGGYTRKGVVYQGPTRPRGRPTKAIVITTAKPKKAKLSKPMKKAVNALIRKEEEVKCSPNLTLANQVLVTGSGLNYDGVTNFNGWATLGSGIIPQVSQGVNETQRIGNRINVRNLSLKFTIVAQPTGDSGPAAINPFKGIPFTVRVLVYRHRYAIDDYGQTGILQQGASSGNLGSTPDLYLEPYNRDEYLIAYSKQWQMMAPRHITNAGVVTVENMAPGTKAFISKKVNIKLPKHLLFNDSVNTPTNAGWFMGVAVCNAEGSVVSNTQNRIMINAESYLTFTDA